MEILRRGVAQLGSAPLWGSGGRGFESRRSDRQKTLARYSLTQRLAGFSMFKILLIP
ncbi:hypothetical protein N9414_17308 [Nodularia spumigena CCY9414]|jgi:hypothetical protein|nr:hypothetical protein N9414_17308 [Nodularia spumigena CCY9414]